MKKGRKCLYAIMMAILLMVTTIEVPYDSMVCAADDVNTVSGDGTSDNGSISDGDATGSLDGSSLVKSISVVDSNNQALLSNATISLSDTFKVSYNLVTLYTHDMLDDENVSANAIPGKTYLLAKLPEYVKLVNASGTQSMSWSVYYDSTHLLGDVTCDSNGNIYITFANSGDYPNEDQVNNGNIYMNLQLDQNKCGSDENITLNFGEGT